MSSSPAAKASWRGAPELLPPAREAAREALAEISRGAGVALTETSDESVDALILGRDLALRAPRGGAMPSPPLLLAWRAPPLGAESGRGIAVHVDGELPGAAAWHEPLRLFGEPPLLVLAATAAEEGTAKHLLHGLERGRRVDLASASDLFAAVDGRRLVVTTVLETAVAAYARNVPFLVAASTVGAAAFLEPRGLSSWTFTDADDLARKARILLELAIDRRAELARERASLATWLGRPREDASRAAEAAPGQSAAAIVALRPEPAPGATATARRDRDLRNLRPMIERLGGDLHRLHHEVAAQRGRIDELAAEVDRQSAEIESRELLLRDILESRAWRLVSSARSGLGALRRRLGAKSGSGS